MLHGGFYSWQHWHQLAFPSDEKSRHEAKNCTCLKRGTLTTQGPGIFSLLGNLNVVVTPGGAGPTGSSSVQCWTGIIPNAEQAQCLD